MVYSTPDLAIIGSGSGNSLITEYWDDKRVVIADGGIFGGTCLNVGCIPTKMFVRPAMMARTHAEAARINVELPPGKADWGQIRDRIFTRIDAISAAGKDYRDLECENVDVLPHYVRLTSPHEFHDEFGTTVTAKQLVIAAGSRAILPDVPGIDLPQIHTSDTVMRLATQPERIVIIGGGFIACEFAGIFSGMGSHVTQLIRGPELMRQLDHDIRATFNEQAASHWSVQPDHQLERIVAQDDNSVVVHAGGQEYPADVVLVAIGRQPNTDLIGAAEAGLDLHEDGRLVVDEYQRVHSQGRPVAGVYALGDISSPSQLKHVANYEARVVIHNLEHPQQLRPNAYPPIPAAVFSYPEVATIGLTEEEAIAAYGAELVTSKVQHYGDTAYGWAMEDNTGLYKVIAHRSSGQILGAHVVGYQASTLIQPAISAMSFNIDAYTAARGQYWIHPALMEVAENALLGVQVPITEESPL